MRIAFHSDTFARKERFGLARYAHSLRDALAAKGVSAIPFSSRTDFGSDQPSWLSDSGFRRLALPRRVLAPAWTYLGAPRVEGMLPPFDVLHSIDVDYRAPTRKPWVVTIHDLGPLVRPEFFSEARPWLLRAYVCQIAARADRIICVSQSTADEMASLAKAPLGDRLTVIHEAVEPKFFERPPAEAFAQAERIVPEGTPFLLFSGSMNPRKNLARVVRAFGRVAPEIPHHLVLVGSLGWGSEGLLDQLQAEMGAGRLHLPGYVSDDVLRALLWRAQAYLYLSLYEGFGLPILEAMAAGCPVVTSDNSSMPEVAGDAALIVNAESDDEISQAIRNIAKDKSLSELLKVNGGIRSRKFSWNKAAEETIDVYRSVK